MKQLTSLSPFILRTRRTRTIAIFALAQHLCISGPNSGPGAGTSYVAHAFPLSREISARLESMRQIVRRGASSRLRGEINGTVCSLLLSSDVPSFTQTIPDTVVPARDLTSLKFLNQTVTEMRLQGQGVRSMIQNAWTQEQYTRWSGQNENAPPPVFLKHEIRSSARVAGYIHERARESLLLTTTLDGIFVPGFDGVILNSQNQSIANFSLKSAPPNARGEILPLAFNAIDGAGRFSYLDAWVFQFINNHSNPSPQWLIDGIELFGVGAQPERPARIALDATESRISIEAIQRETRYNELVNTVGRLNGLVESVLIFNGEQYLDIRPDGPNSARAEYGRSAPLRWY